MIFNNSSFLLSMLLVSTEAFTNLSVTRSNQFAYHHHKSKAHQESSIVLYASSEKDDAVDEVEQTSIPCLPPIGESSFSGETSKDSEMIRLDGTSHAVNHVGSEKFELQYTCKVCETRNIYKISRMAYRNGVVITDCKGCESKHMIADNLGWTNYQGGFKDDNNIEEFMETLGRGEEVNRVSPEVFDLEKMIHDNNVEVDVSFPDDGNTFE